MTDLPTIRLMPHRDKRPKGGHPWIFSNEVQMDAAAKALTPGSPVRIDSADGKGVGVGFFNPHSLIAVRLLARNPDAKIDRALIEKRLAFAAAWRDRLFGKPFYRLCHAEADGLPGLIVDRFGDVMVVQLNAAGMDLLGERVADALERLFKPRAIIFRNDSSGRALEGLGEESKIARGSFDGTVQIEENGVKFQIDPVKGQKTGWFFDQRDNRAFFARTAQGARVLDGFAYAGGFSVQAALAGATEVTAFDRSGAAIQLVEANAKLNGVTVKTLTGEGFDVLDKLAVDKARFDAIVLDPPAFAKSKKDAPPALKGYRKLAAAGARLGAPGAALTLCSCSHAILPERFAEECLAGIGEAGKTARLIRSAGAGPDHPLHPQLPESAYLKCLTYILE